MSDAKGGQIEPIFERNLLVPQVQQVGSRSVEVTYLGENALSEPTWILWNSNEPFLIGVLRMGKMGYTFEQRTSMGPLLHENLSTQHVQRMLGA